MHIGLHVKWPLFLSNFKKIRNFLDRFSKNTQISNFMKICRVEAELFHAGQADGRRDMKLTVAFSNFCESAI